MLQNLSHRFIGYFTGSFEAPMPNKAFAPHNEPIIQSSSDLGGTDRGIPDGLPDRQYRSQYGNRDVGKGDNFGGGSQIQADAVTSAIGIPQQRSTYPCSGSSSADLTKSIPIKGMIYSKAARAAPSDAIYHPGLTEAAVRHYEKPSGKGPESSTKAPPVDRTSKKDRDSSVLGTRSTDRIGDNRPQEHRHHAPHERKLNAQLQEKCSEIESLKKGLRDAEYALQVKNREFSQLQNALRGAQEEVKHHISRNAQNQELLNVRRKELQGASVFLNTSDKYSGADIVSMVKALNAEIFQAAASITDTFAESMTGQNAPENGHTDRSAVADVIEMLGEEVATLLQQSHHVTPDEHITLVQLVLQAGLIRRSERIIHLWAQSGIANTVLEQAFTGIQRQQELVVSRTWRAQTKHLVYQDPRIRAGVAKMVKSILVVAGLRPIENLEMTTRIDKDISGRVSIILSLIAELDEAMTEITSMDLALHIPPSGANFDAWTMEDGDGRATSNGSSNNTVLFVSEAGLKSLDIEARKGRGELTILLKPKVVIRAAFSRKGLSTRNNLGDTKN